MKKLLIALFSLLAIGSANATTITFDNLPGSNGDTFTSYSESGFTVTSTFGNWQVAKLFGSPIPDIFSNSPSASVEITADNSGVFSFDSVDLGYNAASYTFEGLLNGSSIFNDNGTIVGGIQFSTIASLSGALLFDTLRITMDVGTGPGFNIDNIGVTAAVSSVPVPAALFMFAPALLGFFGLRRKVTTIA